MFDFFCFKQVKISANVARKIILFSLWINIIFNTPLADIYACLKQKITKELIIKKINKTCLLYSKCILIEECLDINIKQDKH